MQELFISKKANPFKLSSEKVLLSSPDYLWEKCGWDGINLAFVNEGPSVLHINEKVYIVYSAFGCWCKDYCLGLLELLGDDPLSKGSWKKYDKLIFNSTKNMIGPVHCSITIKNKHNNIERYMIFHSFNKELKLFEIGLKYV